jgi:ubiquinone/menaquinone biosynthesis C-methylase UbiE
VADLLHQGVDWLDGMRTAHLSRSVTYQRGSESVEIAATMGQTTYEVADEYGATVEAVATDFLVSSDELVLGGEKTLPKTGDRIRLAGDDEVLVFEVMDLGGAGHYRPGDPYRRTLRIHTKQVDEE